MCFVSNQIKFFFFKKVSVDFFLLCINEIVCWRVYFSNGNYFKYFVCKNQLTTFSETQFLVQYIIFRILLETLCLCQSKFFLVVLVWSFFWELRLFLQHIWSSEVPLVSSEIDNQQQLLNIVPLDYTWPIYPHMPSRDQISLISLTITFRRQYFFMKQCILCMWWLRSQKSFNFFGESWLAFVKFLTLPNAAEPFEQSNLTFFFSLIVILFFCWSRKRYFTAFVVFIVVVVFGGRKLFFFWVFLLSYCLFLGLRVVNRVFVEEPFDLFGSSDDGLSAKKEEVEGWATSLLSERRICLA